MDASQGYYRELLRGELERRTRKNPRYSLRAFAKALAVDVAALSRVLAGKKALSLRTAKKVAEKLRCTPELQRLFLDSVAKDLRARSVDAVAPDLPCSDEDRPISALAEEMFRVVADWQHFAIIELTYTENAPKTSSEIARALGIGELEAYESVARLKAVGLLEDEGGRLVKVERSVHAKSASLSSPELRSHQGQLARMAADSIANVDPEKRAITTLMLPLDPAAMQTARQMIEEFAWQLCRHLTKGRMTDVYALTINLFPLQGRARK